jgi:peptidoglycan LD-endopeptidase LytH
MTKRVLPACALALALVAACTPLPPPAPPYRGPVYGPREPVSRAPVPRSTPGSRQRANWLMRQPRPRYLPVPVDGLAPRRIADTFGAPRSGGRRHEGLDLFARRGTPVRSTTQGVILHRGLNNLGGVTVSVLGPGGQRHYYAHLDRWAGAPEGAWVEAGEIIGYVGNTGNARTTPPHLHYGIYEGSGHAINPLPLLHGGPGAFR